MLFTQSWARGVRGGREGRPGKVAQRERKRAAEAYHPHTLSPPGNHFPKGVRPVPFGTLVCSGQRVRGLQQSLPPGQVGQEDRGPDGGAPSPLALKCPWNPLSQALMAVVWTLAEASLLVSCLLPATPPLQGPHAQLPI